MDNSRDADLAALHRRFSDPLLSKEKRNRAYRTFQKIQAQVKDRGLVRLRHRLIKAHIADDADEADKLERQIREYGYRKHGIIESQG